MLCRLGGSSGLLAAVGPLFKEMGKIGLGGMASWAEVAWCVLGNRPCDAGAFTL